MARQQMFKKDRVELNPQGSSHGGFAGFYETILRRFKTLVHISTLVPLYALASATMGLALTPAVFFVKWIWDATLASHAAIHYSAFAFALAGAYFIYGFALILVIPAMNALLNAYPVTWRGPYYSLGAVKWYIHNGLTYLARYTFLEFVTPTPFNLWFYKWMGMGVGRGTQINSSNISDPALIELGDHVTIGGSATIVAHYGMGGYLVIAPVTVGNGATIGLKATVMGGVEIGEGAKILPNSVVLPKTKIPPGETWGGVPAQKIEIGKLRKAKSRSAKKAA